MRSATKNNSQEKAGMLTYCVAESSRFVGIFCLYKKDRQHIVFYPKITWQIKVKSKMKVDCILNINLITWFGAFMYVKHLIFF